MNNNQIVGRAIALATAIFYGFNSTLSRLAYDTGTTPVSLILYRFLMSVAIIAVIVLLLRKSWKITPSPLVFVLCVLGMFATSIGHLGAVKYIPVSLAAIIFYTFPLQVVAYKRLVNREAVTRYELSAFILGFIGIGIALGPEFHQFDLLGISLAYFGSLGATLFILSYEHFPAGTDSYVATLWIMIASVMIALLLLLFGFDLVPPKQSIGWLYLILITICSVTSFVLSLKAINRLGGAIFALFLNFEPVIILLLAWIVIGEELSIGRISGMAIVVFALFLSHWRLPQLNPQHNESG